MVLVYAFNAITRRCKISAVRPTISRRTLYPRCLDKSVDVVLLRDFPSLGKKGDIVKAQRGFANYFIIPRGIGLYATWENIDTYASDSNSPAYSTHVSGSNKPGTKFTPTCSRKGLFRHTIEVKTLSKDKEVLCSPVSIYQILDLVSTKDHYDFLPSQITAIIREVDGVSYPVSAKLALTGKYNLSIQVDTLSGGTEQFEICVELLDASDS
uniref:Ribosomal protein L9 domain-containing protein n=2 Tax=Babesia bovis TaxID=5865 RepID=A7AU23_BABBO|eukprot:XP_001610002.1 hypothetical protein [Babesia bovis T2Bo]